MITRRFRKRSGLSEVLDRGARPVQRAMEQFRARRRRETRNVAVRSAIAGGVVGAALAYLLDPERGRRRRHGLKDRAAATTRRGYRGAARLGRWAGAEVYGGVQKLRHLGPRRRVVSLNDPTLAHKVESEALGGADAPRGRINVNAENGVVTLRGEVERPNQIRAIEKAVRRVEGVVDVNNLLHLPATVAPST